MKKLLLLFCAASFFIANNANAQRSRSRAASSETENSAGLTVDFGDGSTLVGPALKHFFDRNNAGQVELLFGNGGSYLAAYYQYNAPIKNSGGLNYYLGIGPALGFGHGNTDFYIRPMAGLDYKVGDTPLDLSFDWRPAFYVGDNSDFTAARFGLGLRFSF
ncbi:hypothetical protein SAMN05216464_10357 [Mucilaginibacter pineti]|uniref:Outer membrane insertion C-terminal signal n=1 Tax=Mucilaginibacter pineti TaxID=1391627 RepID=A0A1G6YSH1_9SPHI|nr:hypothetical protein [Mucilaginibacter pineti]SDD92506.1 hypothetical protein SAMN05216464_10357 [Mucilaginibacter pineti]